ncbi:hypothetical protein GCM10009716_15770 [Streptomyces sodiiphilus]|uniref:Integral membrane protein n=1 Tax=Streptomyces sodiiphilus TaxID=226217 RepID=A0ABP5A879_9ACTN
MTDRRRASGQQRRPSEEKNPFAPPPAGQRDLPWHQRQSQSGRADGRTGSGSDGNDDGNGDGSGNGDAEGQDGQRSRWGSQWSKRQPGRQGGGFGQSPSQDPEGKGGKGGFGPRWDPSDPQQRYARYAVLAGMWGVFTALLAWEWLGLLLGSLALYWGITSLRGGPAGEKRPEREGGTAADDRPEPAGGPSGGGRPQTAAAIAGLVMASLALTIVAASYTVQIVYKDYFDCVEDALTIPSRQACEELLPSQLRPILGERD